MPSNIIGLDSNGSGTYRFVFQVSQLSIANQSGSNISVQINEIGELITVFPNSILEYEEDEAREINTVHIVGGPANSRGVIIYWTKSTFIQRYLPH